MVDDTIKKDIMNPESDIVDVDLGFVEKKKFRFYKDDNRILELNVSDLNITVRLNEGYPKLQALLDRATESINNIPEDASNPEMLSALADTLKSIDAEMRSIIDFIFDSNVSEICAPSGNMFDPVDSTYRFERIIDKLIGFYSTGLDSEFAKVKANVEKKASKYIKKN